MSDAWDGPSGIVYVHPGVYNERIKLAQNVALVGAGADSTILDGQGLGEDLIDFSGARNALVRGFTLTNVGRREDGCSSAVDPVVCEAQLYAAAVNGNGSCDTSIVLMHNFIEGNDTAVALGYHAQAVIQNNLFTANQGGVLSAYQNDHALIMGNTFDGSGQFAVGYTYAQLDVLSNIVVSAYHGIYRAFYTDDPRIEIGCNMFHLVDDPLGTLAPDGSLIADPGFRDAGNRDYRLLDSSWMQDLGCYDNGDLAFDTQPGAYGGVGGGWFQQEITIEELEALFAPAP